MMQGAHLIPETTDPEVESGYWRDVMAPPALRVCEGGVGAKVTALELAPIAGHDRFQHVLPTVR